MQFIPVKESRIIIFFLLLIVGSQPVTLTACSDEVTTLVQASGVSQGGEWSPGECLAKYKVAIIVPVRDREEQVCNEAT